MSTFKDKEITKDGRQWRFKVYYHNTEGKLVPYVSKRFLLEKEAKTEERLFLLKRNAPIKKRLDLIAEDYFKDAFIRLRETTVLSYKSSYKYHIKPYFGNKFIDEITVLDIENWKNKIIEQKFDIKSCNKYHNVFNELFKFASRKYGLDHNPIKLSGRFKRRNDEVIETDKKLRYIVYEQFCKFIDVIDNELWHCFFITLYFTGMRKGEILALNWNDIDFNTKKIKVNKSITFHTQTDRYKITATKNNLNRDITMSKRLLEELKKYKEFVEKYGDFKEDWFVFGNGAAIDPHSVTKAKNKYFVLAGMEKETITIHEFRHSHVSLCINEYLKIGETDTAKFFLMMSNRMGHGIRVMQEVYMHLFPTVQNEIVNLLDNL